MDERYNDDKRRRLLLLGAGILAATALLAVVANAEPRTIAAGTEAIAPVAFCINESEANNVLLAHRSKGHLAAVQYFANSQECDAGVVDFTVVRQVAEYRDLPFHEGMKTFYVVEAKDNDGQVFYIITAVKVVPKGLDT